MPLNFDIRRDNHAISEFSATIKFSQQIDMTTFSAVTDALKVISQKDCLDLPAPMNVQIFQVGIGPTPPSPMAGTGKQRFSSNGEIACSVWCDLDSITLTLREYDRWAGVKSTIEQGLCPLVAAYIKQVPAVRSVSVQYLNEFIAKDPSKKSAAEIFRPESQWISPFSYQSDEPWHCHVGQFIPKNDRFRHLININFDVAPAHNPEEKSIKTVAKLLIMSACNHDIADKGPLILRSENYKESIMNQFDVAHGLEKKLLVEVVSDDYLAIMGDGADEY